MKPRKTRKNSKSHKTLHALTFESKELLQMETKVSVRRKRLPFSCSSKFEGGVTTYELHRLVLPHIHELDKNDKPS